VERENDMTAKPTISSTEALRRALAVRIPGGLTHELSDEPVLGPRGGLRGYERAEGAFRPADRAVTAAVCGRDHCSGKVEHGHSFFFERGFRGKRAKSSSTGPTFRDTVRVRAVISAATSAASTQRAWPDVRDPLAEAIREAMPAAREAARKDRAEDREYRAVEAAMNHPTLRSLAKLAGEKYQASRFFLAQAQDTPPEVLARLACDADGEVRSATARNPSTPPKALARLAEDECVRHAVAANPHTPAVVLAKLAEDEDDHVRMLAARNPSTPPEVLARLAGERRAAQLQM